MLRLTTDKDPGHPHSIFGLRIETCRVVQSINGVDVPTVAGQNEHSGVVFEKENKCYAFN